MSAPGDPSHDVARRILAQELGGRASSGEIAAAIEGAFDRLRRRMITVVGRLGFEALLARAVHLSSPDAPWLATLEMAAGEAVVMKGLTEAIDREGAAEVGRGAAALLAALLRLLSAFIGEGLTHRLIRRAWPDLPHLGAGSEEA